MYVEELSIIMGLQKVRGGEWEGQGRGERGDWGWGDWG